MILEFKNKKQMFNSWLNTVIKANFKDTEIKSAMCFWVDEKDDCQMSFCRYKCDLEQLKWFSRQLQEHIKELEYDEFLLNNIHNYIKYIE